MKKVLPVLLVLCLLCLPAAGCSGDSEKNGRSADVDLTLLSTTMAQAEFQNISARSSDFMGKTIRVNGTYNSMFFDQTGNFYHYVIVVEGDDCCRQGFEFKLTDEDFALDDFPAQGTKIEITGVLSMYEELGMKYVYLAADEIIII